MSGPTIVLTLKVLVAAVTVLFVAAIGAIVGGKRTLHGRLNTAFFVLTLLTVVAFEIRLRLGPSVVESLGPAVREALRVHLMFAVPAAVVLPVMYWSGRTGRRRLHLPLAVLFTILWAGTFVTGIFFLPHSPP